MQKKTLQDVSRTLQQIVKSLSALPSIASHPSDQMAPSIGSCLDLTDGMLSIQTNQYAKPSDSRSNSIPGHHTTAQ